MTMMQEEAKTAPGCRPAPATPLASTKAADIIAQLRIALDRTDAASLIPDQLLQMQVLLAGLGAGRVATVETDTPPTTPTSPHPSLSVRAAGAGAGSPPRGMPTKNTPVAKALAMLRKRSPKTRVPAEAQARFRRDRIFVPQWRVIISCYNKERIPNLLATNGLLSCVGVYFYHPVLQRGLVAHMATPVNREHAHLDLAKSADIRDMYQSKTKAHMNAIWKKFCAVFSTLEVNDVQVGFVHSHDVDPVLLQALEAWRDGLEPEAHIRFDDKGVVSDAHGGLGFYLNLKDGMIKLYHFPESEGALPTNHDVDILECYECVCSGEIRYVPQPKVWEENWQEDPGYYTYQPQRGNAPGTAFTPAKTKSMTAAAAAEHATQVRAGRAVPAFATLDMEVGVAASEVSPVFASAMSPPPVARLDITEALSCPPGSSPGMPFTLQRTLFSDSTP